MSVTLAASYVHCERVAAHSASNFYWSFRLLPVEKRRAMAALYAFFRTADDIGDQPGAPAAKRAALARFRTETQAALTGPAAGPLFVAFADAVHRYQIPHEYFFAVLDGVALDIDGFRPANFAELEAYCYRVASVVGLACLHVWGFTDPAVLQPGRACGIAFQLTNIFRDLSEDLANGRSYLPHDEVASPDALTASDLQFQFARVEQFYREGAEVERYLLSDGRRIFGAMFETYAQLFCSVRRAGVDVLVKRVRLSRWRKLRLLIKWMFWPRPKIRLPF